MKKLFSLPISIGLLLALSLAGCEDEKKSDELIIGKWNVDSGKWTDYENGVKTDEGTMDFAPGEVTIEFIKGGTGKLTEDSEVSTFTWEIVGDLLILEPDDDDPIDMDYSVTETELKLKFSYEETFEGIVYKEVTELFCTRD